MEGIKKETGLPEIRIYIGNIQIWTKNLDMQDKKRQSFCGRLLLGLGILEAGDREILKKARSMEEIPQILDLVLKTGKHGKPFLEELPGFFFNISHSGNFAACAAGQVPCGLDIQEIRGFQNKRMLEKIMNRKEQEQILNARNRDLAFSRLWAKKESMVKLSGEGITCSLKDLPDPGWQERIEYLPYYTGNISADCTCRLYQEEVFPERLEKALKNLSGTVSGC